MKTNNAVVNYILDEMAVSSCCEPPSVWFIFVVRPAFLCADVSFFLTVHLETNYLRMYWTDLRQIFRIGTYVGEHG